MPSKEQFSALRLICLSQLMTEDLDKLEYTDYKNKIDRSALKIVHNDLLLLNVRQQPGLQKVDEELLIEYTAALYWAVNQINLISPEELIHEYNKNNEVGEWDTKD